MLINEFDPQKDEMLQVMDNNGKIINPKWKPDISDDLVLDAYKFMHFARAADLLAVSYQRQGRMYTYPPNLGQEAISVAVGKLIRKEDWLVPAFREMSAWLLKGARLQDIFMYFGGYEEGSTFPNAPGLLPSSVPIASQLPHAVGIGYALNYKKEKSMVYAFVGDGGTSEGDFHEALNFAGVWKVPVLFIVQNNQFAISVPVKGQTASINLAVKGIAYGIPSIKVDGNDFFAMYRAVQEANKFIMEGKGPVLIEALTFRRGAHTTSDDPTLYRTLEEEKLWEEKDPIKRLRGYLISKGLWKEEDDVPLVDEYKKEVEKEFSVFENHSPYAVEDVFKYTFKEMPDELKHQLAAYQKYLKWKEGQK